MLQVRSLTLDKMKPEWEERLRAVGNTVSNNAYEELLPADFDRRKCVLKFCVQERESSRRRLLCWCVQVPYNKMRYGQSSYMTSTLKWPTPDRKREIKSSLKVRLSYCTCKCMGKLVTMWPIQDRSVDQSHCRKQLQQLSSLLVVSVCLI